MTTATIDREKRERLRAALAAYLRGELRTFAFDDENCACGDTKDESLRLISRQLYLIHDDTVDHPISVSEPVWAQLQQIAAFLGTDLEAAAQQHPAWPFADEQQWQAHRQLALELALPAYDPAVHDLEVLP